MMGVFAEFERSMIVVRVRGGMARAREKGTKSGRAIGWIRSGERQSNHTSRGGATKIPAGPSAPEIAALAIGCSKMTLYGQLTKRRRKAHIPMALHCG